MEQLSRIIYMESLLDRCTQGLRSGLAPELFSDAIRELSDYYSSPLWRADFEADEAGMLPADLKRGVLSEDAVYDLLCSHSHLIKELKTIIEKNRR